jgi:hypothetical protein
MHSGFLVSVHLFYLNPLNQSKLTCAYFLLQGCVVGAKVKNLLKLSKNLTETAKSQGFKPKLWAKVRTVYNCSVQTILEKMS